MRLSNTSRISKLQRNLIILIGICIFLAIVLAFLLFKAESKQRRLKTYDIYTNFNISSKRTRNSTDTLIDLKGFQFLLQNEAICQLNINTENNLLLIIILSSRENFKSRNLIRKTWGSVNYLKGWDIRYVFLLGKSPDNIFNAGEIDLEIFKEYKQFEDLIVGNFPDTYRTLSYKQIMGFKWASNYCSNAKLLLKTDDDVFLDIYQLIKYINNDSSLIHEDKIIVGSVNSDSLPDREEGGRWFVTKEEYSRSKYPSYCIGMGFIVSFVVVNYFIKASEKVPYFWIEDVYVTGLLREYLNEELGIDIRLVNLYGKYIFMGEEAYENWLSGASGKDTTDKSSREGFPWIFVHCWNSYFLTRFEELWKAINYNQ